MNISILTIGDEILIGQIINTNAAWLAEQFTLNGFPVLFHSVVPDNESFIKSEVYRLWEWSDVIVATGGLGPTHDDITKKALTKLFNDKLVFSEKTFEQIKMFFKNRGREITERNKDQAMVPSLCQVLNNPLGTAPGMKFEKKGKLLYSLPGVPREMKAITTESIIPELLKLENNSKKRYYKTFHTCGIPESTLADLIDAENTLDSSISLAYLPGIRGVRMRFGTDQENQNDANNTFNNLRKHIIEKAEKYLVGEDENNILNSVAGLLKKHGKTVAVAESCTAGILGAEFTSLSESSAYFLGGFQVYSNESKENILHVRKHTIEKYGAVSEETAIEMAENIRTKFDSDFGISITGIAGPDGGTEDKPVGTVWIGISSEKNTKAKKFNFGSDRNTNRQLSVTYSLFELFQELKSY